MVKQNLIIHQAELLDENLFFTLYELSQRCSVHKEFIIEMVEQGIIEPVNENSEQWHFQTSALKRTQTILRLQNDLGINLSGAAVILDLLDELEHLRSQIIHYDKMLTLNK